LSFVPAALVGAAELSIPNPHSAIAPEFHPVVEGFCSENFFIAYFSLKMMVETIKVPLLKQTPIIARKS
jgi:hypothetical protein